MRHCRLWCRWCRWRCSCRDTRRAIGISGCRLLMGGMEGLARPRNHCQLSLGLHSVFSSTPNVWRHEGRTRSAQVTCERSGYAYRLQCRYGCQRGASLDSAFLRGTPSACGGWKPSSRPRLGHETRSVAVAGTGLRNIPHDGQRASSCLLLHLREHRGCCRLSASRHLFSRSCCEWSLPPHRRLMERTCDASCCCGVSVRHNHRYLCGPSDQSQQGADGAASDWGRGITPLQKSVSPHNAKLTP